MKICFIGVGSIATRHINNLNIFFSAKNTSVIFDALRRQKKNNIPLIENTWLSIEEMPNDYDVIFITNPTHLHYETLSQVLNKTKHIFIEKPVFDKIDYDISKLPLKPDSVYYVACPIRYNSVIQWVKEYVAKNKVIYARAICSSYLPDWRPNVDYRTVYSANKDMGGGVIIDLIHEWDYLQYLFGFPNHVNMLYGKFSNLEINSEDSADYIASYTDKTINLHLDYLGKFPRRQIEIYTNNETIIVDLNSKTINMLKSEKTISLPQSRDKMQMAELEFFLSIIEGKSTNTNTIETAIKTMRTALGECI